MKRGKMAKIEKNPFNPFGLDGFDFLIYGIMKKHEIDGVKSTLENVHFEAVEYILKHRPNFKGNTDTVKTLKKIATPNKTTGEWKLKAEFFE